MPVRAQGDPQSRLCCSWGIFEAGVQAEDGQEQVGVVSDAADAGGDFRVSGLSYQSYCQVTESRHYPGSRAGPDPGRVLTERDITDPVDLVLYAPVDADVTGQVLRRGLAG